jgi:hypothetical protein
VDSDECLIAGPYKIPNERAATVSVALVDTLLKGLKAAFSPEIEDPNNSKRNNDRGDAQPEYKPDVMPGYTLPSLARWYYWALLRSLGRTHDVLLSLHPFPFCNSFGANHS